MKSLTTYIKESYGQTEEGTTNWQKLFDTLLEVDNGKATKADFEEVQENDWIWDKSTGDPATSDFLMELYTKFKNEKVEWVAKDIRNAIAYVVKDSKGHSLSFDSTEMLEF